MTVGERIKYYRTALGMTQFDVAKAIGTTKQAIYKYETGVVTNIPTPKIQAMANLFGTTPAILAGWDSDNGIEETKQPTDDGELSEDLMKISALISELDDSRLGAALEIAQKISTLSEAEVAALLAVVRSMGGK